MIEIEVNGEARQVPPGLSVAGLLAHLGVDGARVAVELNREIVSRPRWAEAIVGAGARVEVVQFVGGG